MPNKVLSYYTTDGKYKAVGSNHLSNIRYDEDSLSLWITFYNKASYIYYGVPKHLYEGMMASPSHGTFFWANIRQRFTYKLLDGGQPQDKPNDILAELSKGHKKLDYLDQKEKELEKQLQKGLIEEEKYNLTLELILSLREKASDIVDREMGVYVTPTQKKKEIREAIALVEEIRNNVALEKERRVKKVLGVLFIVGGLVLLIHHPILGFLVGGTIYKVYQRGIV